MHSDIFNITCPKNSSHVVGQMSMLESMLTIFFLFKKYVNNKSKIYLSYNASSNVIKPEG